MSQTSNGTNLESSWLYSETKMGEVQHSPKKQSIMHDENNAKLTNLTTPPFSATQSPRKKIALTANLINCNLNENKNNELSATNSSSTANKNHDSVLGQCNEQQALVQTGLDRYFTVQAKRKRSPRSAQLASRSKATRIEQTEDQIPLSNRYSSLEVEAPEATVDNAKNEKPPPIYLREASNNELVKKIKSLTDSKFYITSLKRGKINEVKIQPFEINGFRALVNYFDQAHKRYYTYQLKSQKGLTVVIRGIESSVDVSEIHSALKEKGFHAKTITNIVNREKVPQPLFRLELEPDTGKDKERDIYKLRYLLYRKITVEEPKKRTGPVQCIKCQEYGHTKAYCTLHDVCVICGELHDSKLCNKVKNDPTVKRCSNCGENHTANYRGCPVYLDLKRKINPKLRYEQRMLKANYNQRTLTPRTSVVQQTGNLGANASSFAQPGISYANILKGTASKAKVNFIEEEVSVHATVNKLTETIQSFMMMMEKQMSMMMQNMNTLMQIIVKNQK